MKTKLLAAALVASGFSINAIAADTASLTVNATVNGVCKFTAPASATLTLSNVALPATGIDPSSATSATGSTTLLYRCTKGQAPGFSAGQGNNWSGSSNQVKHATLADVMAYSLSLSPSAPTGAGFAAADQTLTITGSILQADFQAAAAGNYTDTVVISVTP